MLFIYVIIELVSLILIISGEISNTNIYKYIPIVLNFIFVINKKTDKKLLLSFFIITIADYIFLFLNNCILGISLFIIVQILYYQYLNKVKNIIPLILGLLNIILVIIFNKKILIIESIIYLLLILTNIYKAFKLAKNNQKINLFKYSLFLLLLCDILIGIKYISHNNFLIINIFEWIFYILSQLILVIYIKDLSDSFLYRLLQPLFYLIFKIYYNPTIINKEYIPKNGRCVIAGNHKHALDPILVDTCTKRVVHTLAKKDLHDGMFGWFFKAIGTIPVDLHAKHNKDALNSAVEYLNNDHLINLSPEAKRNYTKEILLPFKYGAVVMAKRTNSKIVPYSITGDYKFRSKNLKIVFGKPLDISKLEIEDANQLLYKKVKKLILDNRK